ncbi:unnamed protein product [Nyctereutes procyonoides]|uniref:(raccoon dog) hypothetical protein n=1 Tax=Nyctereutes procyonoides TaxID=34880 RepID=A0A811Y4Z9_NYCPR|nr:unnamed protein product [Nyctereutes procyonoides]
MEKQKKASKYLTMKQMLSPLDQKLKEKDRVKSKKKDPSALKQKEVSQHPPCLFFPYHTQLGPHDLILVDTNFINFSIKVKLDLVQSMMGHLYARIAKGPRFERLPCTHKGTYCCIVATVDWNQKIPRVPISYISNYRYNKGWMPDDSAAPDSNF